MGDSLRISRDRDLDRTIKLFPADDIPERGRDDSLIAALIEKLPPPGTRWPLVERKAWLEMMSTAFVVLYGGPAGGEMAQTAPARSRAPASKRKAAAKPKARAAAPKPAPVTKPQPTSLAPLEPDFYIDKDGFARAAGGVRILPGDVGDVLVDLRGEKGDLGAITWADDSQGTKGYQLDIQAA